MHKRLFLFIFLMFCVQVLPAQQVPPSGQFLVDSMKIGEPVPYSLSFSYEAQHDAVFPDSLFNFTPFEIDHKDYFPTTTAAGISKDSAVFYLSYFDIDTVQVYALPVILVQNGDSVRLMAEPDTIFLKQLVTEIPDSVSVEAMPLRENTDPVKMDLAVNYPYILIGSGIFILIVAIIIAVFGKKIMMYIRLRRMNIKYSRFIRSFDALADEMNIAGSEKSEKLVILWKNYLQQLENFPYTTLTTKEVVARIPKDGLTDVLHQLDYSMYSPKHPSVDRNSIERLKDFATERYQREMVKAKNRE